MSRPFFVLGTPRSRTAWLAAFLSVEGRPCQHEPSRFLRTHDDLLALLRCQDAAVSDSALTFRWRDIARECRDARIVVVRRPLGEVLESCAGAGLPPAPKMLRRLSREIDLMCASLPVFIVPFHRLAHRSMCEAVYEFCHGKPPLPWHWQEWCDRNVQADVPAAMAAALANLDGIHALFPEMVAA